MAGSPFALPNLPLVDDKGNALPAWYQVFSRWNTAIQSGGGAGTGDVTGPASSTDGNVALFNGATGKIIKDSGKALTATGVGLGSVSNDAQTKAAIVPNTAPAAGNLLVGNAGGTAYASVSSSGDVTVSSTGVFTIGAAKVTYAQMQNVSAASKLLGRGSAAGAGSPEPITLGTGLSMSGTTLNVSGGTGDVVGPASSVSGNIALFSGTTGKLISDSGFAVGVGSETMLANVTLGSAAASLSSGTIAACKFLRVEIYISGYAGSDTASLQFNGSGGTAYRYRWLTCAGGATTFAAGNLAPSTDRIKVAAVNTTASRRVVAFISNDSSNTEKLVTFSEASGTTLAATQAAIDLGNGAWVSAAATSITQIALISSSNMNAGTKMTVFGWN